MDSEFMDDFLPDALSGELVVIDNDSFSGFPVGLGNESSEKAPANPALRYLASLKSNNSRVNMGYALNRVAGILNYKDFNALPWGSLNYDVVQFIVRQLREDGLAPATINTYLTAIKQVCKNAWRDRVMDRDTFDRINDISGEKGKRVTKGRSLLGSEIKSLLSTCGDMSNPTNIRDSAIIVIMRVCGLRREEVTMLKSDSVNLNNNNIRIIGKGNKERVLRIPSNTVPIISRWIQHKRAYAWRDGVEPEWLFVPVHKTGKLINRRLSNKAIHEILKRRMELSNVDKFSPHDLRRTFATSLLSSGVAITDVQQLMGHSDVSTTQMYDMRDHDRLMDISESINIF